jgi:hypothetical protein
MGSSIEEDSFPSREDAISSQENASAMKEIAKASLADAFLSLEIAFSRLTDAAATKGNAFRSIDDAFRTNEGTISPLAIASRTREKALRSLGTGFPSLLHAVVRVADSSPSLAGQSGSYAAAIASSHGRGCKRPNPRASLASAFPVEASAFRATNRYVTVQHHTTSTRRDGATPISIGPYA